MTVSQFIPHQGLMLILSSPSGAGKTTLAKKLLQIDNNIKLSISITTRPQRSNEVDGVDYHFVTTQQYDEMLQNDQLLEAAKVFDYFYGTPKVDIEERLRLGYDTLFDIDWQGTQALKAKMPNNIVSIFILPPSIIELQNRLKNRAQDNDKTLKKRMGQALIEISHWPEYDYVLVNDDLNHTLNKIINILNAERLKKSRNYQGIESFVNNIDL